MHRLSRTDMAECVFDISLMAQHLIEEHRINVENSRSLFNAILTWAKEFETACVMSGGEDDYMEKIEEFAEERLLAAYGHKAKFKPKVIVAMPVYLARGMIADP